MDKSFKITYNIEMPKKKKMTNIEYWNHLGNGSLQSERIKAIRSGWTSGQIFILMRKAAKSSNGHIMG